jgi:neurotransmitter:Na+ symporter, NSS family
MTTGAPKESWGSRMGVIMAVAGSAVGLGNFLRFPGLAARYGSGAFMIAYFISLLILGIPICWAEWTLGRYAGQQGFRSSPGIFYALIRHPIGKYIGVLGALIPVTIYMYYVYIEAWCLGYSWYSVTGKLNLGGDVAAYGDFWARFVGATQNGLTISQGHNQVVIFLLIVFALNFWIIYRGISKGIETFCKWGMPALIVLALIVLARVLTLGTPDPAKPGQNLFNGLGAMWNPQTVVVQEEVSNPQAPGGQEWVDKEELVGARGIDAAKADIANDPTRRVYTKTIWAQLSNPQLWLAAAGQIFFSLSVGFGVIITYASYLTEKDDVVLSGLTASSANEFCEVALGGLITVPAAFVFLGAAGVVGQGTSSLGFKVLPLVFSKMPAPWFFGGAWFFLLFLAAITSSLSMLQPGIAFLEEGLGINRKQSVGLLGLLTALGCLFVVYFSADLKALDTIDFWVGTFLIFVLATILIIVFGWVLGIERGWQEAHKGAAIRIPNFYKPIIKYLCPLYLLTIFSFWVLFDVLGWNAATKQFAPKSYITDLIGPHSNDAARLSIGLIAVLIVFFMITTAAAGKRWDNARKQKARADAGKEANP